MQRKIIQQSPTSTGISLPKKWADRLNLKKGDTLEVKEMPNQLLITASSKPAFTKTEIDASKFGSVLKRAFNAAYKKGYDEVTILLEKPENLSEITEAINVEANTFEIIHSGKDSITVRAISEISKDEFENLIARTLFILKEQSALLLEYALHEKKENLEKILEFERANNKLTHICRRALHRGVAEENTLLLYAFLELLEKVADEFKFLCKIDSLKMGKETNELMTGVNQLIEQTIALYLKFDAEKANQLNHIRKKNTRLGISILKDAKQAKLHIITHHLLNINELTFDVVGLIIAMRV